LRFVEKDTHAHTRRTHSTQHEEEKKGERETSFNLARIFFFDI